MKNLKITSEKIDTITVVSLDGFLDLSEVSNYERAIEKHLKSNCLKIILDFSQLTYISSAGVAALIKSIRAFRRQGGDLKISALADRSKEILDIYGFTNVYETFLTREDAIMRFKEV